MWKEVIDYFQTLEHRPAERMAFLVGGLLFFWIIEGAIPLIQPRYKKNKWRHAAVNFGFTVIHLLIHTFLAIVIVLLSDWCKQENFGLVYWMNANVATTIIISIIVFDFFGGWLVHFTQHKTTSLWRFHVVHHTDNNVDVTTGLRHHPLESVWRGLFFLIAIVISGAPIYAVMIYQTLLTIFTGITHANISLPKPVDKIMSYILVSPNMHKVHHHWKQPYTDSNYGGVFSIWDRIFGTFKVLDPKELRYGLDRYYPNEKDEDLVALLKKPFQKLNG